MKNIVLILSLTFSILNLKGQIVYSPFEFIPFNLMDSTTKEMHIEYLSPHYEQDKIVVSCDSLGVNKIQVDERVFNRVRGEKKRGYSYSLLIDTINLPTTPTLQIIGLIVVLFSNNKEVMTRPFGNYDGEFVIKNDSVEVKKLREFFYFTQDSIVIIDNSKETKRAKTSWHSNDMSLGSYILSKCKISMSNDGWNEVFWDCNLRSFSGITDELFYIYNTTEKKLDSSHNFFRTKEYYVTRKTKAPFFFVKSTYKDFYRNKNVLQREFYYPPMNITFSEIFDSLVQANENSIFRANQKDTFFTCLMKPYGLVRLPHKFGQGVTINEREMYGWHDLTAENFAKVCYNRFYDEEMSTKASFRNLSRLASIEITTDKDPALIKELIIYDEMETKKPIIKVTIIR